MVQKENGTPTLGEISTIRDILMGQQMSEYEARFAQMEAYLKEAEEQIQRKIDTLSGESSTQLANLQTQTQQHFNQFQTNTDERLNQLEGTTHNRIAELEKLLIDQTDRLKREMMDTSISERQRIGKLLLDMGNQLMEV